MAKIKLRKLTGIKVGNEENVSSSNFGNNVKGLLTSKEQLVFSGQDYKGVLDPSNNTLELYLKGPEDYLKIKGINIKDNENHTLSSVDKEATINISVTALEILARNNEWLTTELDMKGVTAANSSIKFGEWNNYDLPDKFHVEIDFT
ncbi:hypothetical protein [Wolbachia endosymbiont of Ctenocephalides felis wCfeJ]|uniref:hypothetical protein n=1 Tax=Wolbachia endosymbiont of Ctenocephalides felis wCfeJ TaxID=2732594 RepID=UPI001445981C|nr:hypothetical protein [Wolbachia endosymbiont of Ctenocephalides felis wCfeJ]WCR58228.1 MAG: hypothetical protein PG980_000700 [Wolbachia endosymbiont of Ctenocephalides felis wCfeJ]